MRAVSSNFLPAVLLFFLRQYNATRRKIIRGGEHRRIHNFSPSKLYNSYMEAADDLSANKVNGVAQIHKSYGVFSSFFFFFSPPSGGYTHKYRTERRRRRWRRWKSNHLLIREKTNETSERREKKRVPNRRLE